MSFSSCWTYIVYSRVLSSKREYTGFINVVSLNVKETTLQTYQSLFNNHILPFLGEVKVQELTPAMLDDWLRSRSKTGLSRNTLRNSHDLIKHALDYAVHPAQLISSNPAVYIKVPKNAPKNIVKRTIITKVCREDDERRKILSWFFIDMHLYFKYRENG